MIGAEIKLKEIKEEDIKRIKLDLVHLIQDLKDSLEQKRVDYTRTLYDQAGKKALDLLNKKMIHLLPTFYSLTIYFSSVLLHEMPKEEMSNILDNLIYKYELNLKYLSNDILFIWNLTKMKEDLKELDEGSF